ncbi:hypothetical protein HY250_00925 [Candidatus Azambacteria bacterium]|nr:hypothetical protein [Candidatus Azambacteria bacterium]MBI3684953.1 hypothetical protein [Candidatus Azambacteria bacterium]
MAKVLEKIKAVALRRKGLSYREIMDRIPSIVSKGTLSRWCNAITLTPSQFAKLEKHMHVSRDRARFRAIITNRRNREKRDNEIGRIARKEFEQYKKERLFFLGIALYWAEGAKTNRCFQFMNSDSTLVQIMIRWIKRYLKVQKDGIKIRLYLHKIYKNENCENFWEKVTGIPQWKFLKTVYKPTRHTVKKNLSYKGCARVQVNKVAPWLKVMEWENCVAKLMRL